MASARAALSAKTSQLTGDKTPSGEGKGKEDKTDIIAPEQQHGDSTRSVRPTVARHQIQLTAMHGFGNRVFFVSDFSLDGSHSSYQLFD
jgi:hypothetical protein